MEVALALIYVLLQIVSPDTASFTLSVTPDTVFYGTKQEKDVWRIKTGKEDSKTFFGDVQIEGRRLIITTKQGEIPFEAADKVGLSEKTDWRTLQTFGKKPVIYEIRRAKNRVEFVFTIEGADHPQSIVATLKP